MKGIISTILMLSLYLFLNSCNRNMSVGETGSIVGTWELREDQSGMIPTKEYTAGNGNKWKFTGNKYEYYNNGNLVKSGTYKIIKDDSVEAATGLEIGDSEFSSRIVLDNDISGDKLFINIEKNMLTILSGYFPTDGGSKRIYERIESK